jgi:malate synthase
MGMIEVNRERVGRLEIESSLYVFIKDEISPGISLSAEWFWTGLEELVDEFAPRNRTLLEKRDMYQEQIDAYLRERAGMANDTEHYKQILHDIGYIVEQGEDFTIGTQGVDPELSTIAGPQLVVSVNNSRYAVNVVNGLWGSLYDALYGSDVIPERVGAEKGQAYNPVRGDKVVAYSLQFFKMALNNLWRNLNSFTRLRWAPVCRRFCW